MTSVRYFFDFDPVRNKHGINMEPNDKFVWLNEFVSECSFLERCDHVLTGLSKAMAQRERWSCCVNEIALYYDPLSEMVKAVFLLDDVDNENSMDALEFRKMFAEWREVLSSAFKSKPGSLV